MVTMNNIVWRTTARRVGRIAVYTLGFVFMVGCSNQITGVAVFPAEGSAAPFGIACDYSGTEWYTEPQAGQIAERFRDGRTLVFQVKTVNGDPTYLALSLESTTTVWFTEPRANRIGRISARGLIQEYSLPTRMSGPLGIASDWNGGAWFTEYLGNRIGHVDRDGKLTEFTIPTKNSGPFKIDVAPGQNGSAWFTERDANNVGFVDVAGKFKEFHFPHPNGKPSGIVAQSWQEGGSPGAWIAGSGSGYISYVSPDGHFLEQQVSGAPAIIVEGGNSDVWYVDPITLTFGNIYHDPSNASSRWPAVIKSIGDMTYCGFENAIWATEPDSRELAMISIYTATYP